VGLVSSVGVATGDGLDGPGIESRWGRDFPHPYRPTLRPTLPPVQWVTGVFPECFPECKATGAWRYPPTPSNVEVKDIVEIYFYFPSGLSWPVIGWNLPLPLLCATVGGRPSRIKWFKMWYNVVRFLQKPVTHAHFLYYGSINDKRAYFMSNVWP
jgi:hypothetical protein